MKLTLPSLTLALILSCPLPHSGLGQDLSGIKLAPSAGLIEVPVTFTLKQRQTLPIPGTLDQILITSGDITRGQVTLSLSRKDGTPLVGLRTLRQDEHFIVTIDGKEYRLHLKVLRNVLIGEDTVDLVLSDAQAEAPVALTPQQEISALLLALEGLKDVSLLRNGTAYTAKDAVRHLNTKWVAAADSVQTAEDFIIKIGTQSTASGESYVIKLADGSTTTTAAWFTEQLKALRAKQALPRDPTAEK